MRFLCFSDLHKSVADAARLAAQAREEGVDAMLSVGDLGIDFAHSAELYAALAKAGKPILSVPGNHDGVVNYEQSLELGGLTDIDGKVHEFGNLTIAGWGYRWAGQSLDPNLDRVGAILASADARRTVLLSHLPPWGVRVARDSKHVDRGSKQLRKWVQAFKPAVVVCGHVHLANAQTSRIGETLVVNGGRQGWLLEL